MGSHHSKEFTCSSGLLPANVNGYQECVPGPPTPIDPNNVPQINTPHDAYPECPAHVPLQIFDVFGDKIGKCNLGNPPRVITTDQKCVKGEYWGGGVRYDYFHYAGLCYDHVPYTP